MMRDSTPVFVKMDKYKEVMQLVELIDKKIGNARQTLTELEEVKQRENEELEAWARNIEDIRHKMDDIRDQLRQ
jgi:uncharacterized protein Yka (UPF0111/DUF47 family)